ncbi:MAG: hypothetical protein ACOX3T_00120 [Bdellovibrionota bacterium]
MANLYENNQKLNKENNNSSSISLLNTLSEAWKLTQTKGVKSGIWKTSLKAFIICLSFSIIVSISVYGIFYAFRIKLSINNLNAISNLFLTLPFIIFSSFILIRNMEVIKTNDANYSKLLKEIKKYIPRSLIFFLFYTPTYVIMSIVNLLIILEYSYFSLANLLAYTTTSILGYIFIFTLVEIILKDIKGTKNVLRKFITCTKVVFKHFFLYLALAIINTIIQFSGILIIPLIWALPFINCINTIAYTKENFDA